jgi:hypothetical protein
VTAVVVIGGTCLFIFIFAILSALAGYFLAALRGWR